MFETSYARAIRPTFEKFPGVAAFIQLDPAFALPEGEAVLKADILQFLKNKLASFEMPIFIEFMKELPLTPLGKLDKKLLRNNAPELLSEYLKVD